MKKSLTFNWLLIAVTLMLLTLAPCVSAQAIADLKHPLVDGQRALTFRMDSHDLDLDRLKVRVFYSDDASELNDLDDNSLSRGTAVLEGGSAIVFATFIFPHPDHRSPNRSLYFRHFGRRNLIRYPEVNAQVSRAPNFNHNEIDEDSPIDINPIVHTKGDCVYYRIQIKTGQKARQFTSEIMSFRMPDTYNIGLAGDSYGSGEGAPGKGWGDKDCHRSNRSGLTRGVKQMIHDYPDIAVDYRNVACSGATMADLTSREGETSGTGIRQLLRLATTFHRGDHSELHLLIMSIGGNDVGFGSYIFNFYVQPFNAAQTEGQEDIIAESIDGLRGRYRTLDAAIRDRFPTVDIAISTYPDPTNGPLGRCGTSNGIFELEYPCCQFEVDRFTNPVEEYEFSSEKFVAPLNQSITDAATENSWRVINVGDTIGEHGICNCNEPYINTLAASIGTQGDAYGYFHPNDEGYIHLYRDKVLRAALVSFEAFERRRTQEIVRAMWNDDPADDILIPRGCSSVRRTPRYLQWLRLLTHARIPEHLLRFPGFANLLADERAQEAINKGDLKRLEALPTYQTFLAQRAEFMTSLGPALPKRPVGQKPTISHKLHPSVIDAQRRAKAYLKSPEFQALKLKIKATAPWSRVKPMRDLLDDLYNRPIITQKKKPRRLVRL